MLLLMPGIHLLVCHLKLVLRLSVLLIVGALIVGALIVGALIVGALIVGALIVGALIVGALIVGGLVSFAIEFSPKLSVNPQQVTTRRLR